MSGRIPQAFIDDLVARSDVADVVGARINLKKTGKNYSALCPFHNEKSPSFSINPDKQFYYCFGCGASGNALTFLMEYDNLEFVEAVETLARSQGVQVPREDFRGNQKSSQAHQEQKKQTDQRLACMEAAKNYYQQVMRQGEGKLGLDYFNQQRGLSDELLNNYALGVAPEGWEGLKKHLNQAGFSEALQIELGLLVKKEDTGRVYDRFRNRVVFPIRNTKGHTVGFGGRVLDDSKPKYLNSPETPLFHKSEELYGLYEARKQPGRLDRLLVVEGYMDVVALAQQGIHWAVATLGTAASEEHLKRIFRLVNEVVFCFDGDAAGTQAAARAMQTLLPLINDGRHARFLFLPAGEDPDTLVRKEGAGLFEQRVNQAMPLAEYLVSYLRQDLDLNLLDDQARMAQAARPLIQNLADGLLKRRLVSHLQSLTGLTSEDLQAEHLPIKQQTYQPIKEKVITENTSRTLPAEEKLLRLLVRYPDLISQVPEKLEIETQRNASAEVLHSLLEYLRKSPHITTQVLMAYWSGTNEGEAYLQRARLALELNRETAAEEIQAISHYLINRKAEEQVEARYSDLLGQPESSQLPAAEMQELWKLVQQKHLKSEDK
ncbi:DNA primase [Marinospirillum insulare]|uniref:DNA primase n=1 Tax=Marinospirillum insulare TaxID=217169 RepID=A0ABQ5ZVG3_9GAMM|nr:DNA primase [Marinospirillum insulare]GLR63027.1 DNA primase [Marinospirillum insulare]